MYLQILGGSFTSKKGGHFENFKTCAFTMVRF